MKRAAPVVFSVFLFVTSTARAQQPSATDKAAADLLFTDAEKLVESGQIAAACPKFAESQRLDPQLGTLLHLADCYDKNQQTASAWASFREAAELAARRGDSREQVARERSIALEPKLVKMTIVVAPAGDVPGLEIERDGQRVARVLWGAAVPVDPGKHVVVAKAEGKQPWTSEIEAKEPGGTVQVTVPVLVAKAAPPPPAAPPQPIVTAAPSPEKPASRGGSGLKTVGWITAGVGLAALATGAVFAGLTASKSSEADAICPTSRNCSASDLRNYETIYGDAETAQTASTGFFVAGGVLVTAGIIMIVASPSSPKNALHRGLRVGFGSASWSAPW